MVSETTSGSRRAFIKGAGALAGGAWLTAHMSEVLAAASVARDRYSQGAAFENIDAETVPVLSAVADQIYPPDELPGAVGLGAVHFIDYAIGSFMAGAWPMVRNGLQDFDRQCREATGQSFDDLSFDEQTRRLQAVEQAPFFGVVHLLTLLGCFTLPEYGGNRDGQGWAQLGFERRHYWQPPFGDYDAGIEPGQQTATGEGNDHEHA